MLGNTHFQSLWRSYILAKIVLVIAMSFTCAQTLIAADDDYTSTNTHQIDSHPACQPFSQLRDEVRRAADHAFIEWIASLDVYSAKSFGFNSLDDAAHARRLNPIPIYNPDRTNNNLLTQPSVQNSANQRPNTWIVPISVEDRIISESPNLR